MAVAGTITTVSAGVVDAAVTVGTDAITIKTHAVGDAGVVQIWYV